MPDYTSVRSPREQQVDALIAGYHEAEELGQPPDQAGFLKQHPDFAEELREYFLDVEQIEQVALPLDPALEETQSVSDSAPTSTGLRKTMARHFGDYEILEELGAGGMGVVYKARQTKLKKIVALKMIKAGHLASDAEVRRFQAEAQAAAKLDHPGIVAVHEVGVQHGQHYYTMDFVGGGSLSGLHRDGPVASRGAAELVQQLAEAMHYAHGQGIVHRDLKPANVLLTTGGAPRITDFGLAKRMWSDDESAEVSMTQSGQILGTAGYMSPEQAAGKTRLVGPPADIYALGAVLYALLTSRAPFVGESQADTILQVIHKEPVSPRTLNPSVHRDLETICLKCLEKETHRRYGTAQLLADDLTRFLQGRPVGARPVSRLEHGWRWCRRNPWGATSLALLMLVAIVSPPIAWRQTSLANELTTSNANLKTEEGKTQSANTELAKTIVTLNNAVDELGTANDDLLIKDAENQQLNSGLNTANQNLKGKLDENQRLVETLTAQDKSLRAALYRADMQRLPRLLDNPNLGVAEKVLKQHLPQTGQDDLRSFEWYFLWRRGHAHEQRGSRDLVSSPGRTATPAIAISPDHRFSASYSSPAIRSLTFRELANGGILPIPQPPKAGPFTALAFSPDSRRLVVTSNSPDDLEGNRFSLDAGKVQLSIYDTSTRKIIEQPFELPAEEGEKFLYWSAFDGQGRVVVPSVVNGKIRRLTVWDIEKRERVASVPSQQEWSSQVAGVVYAVSANGKRLACANASATQVEVWDWDNFKLVRMLGHPANQAINLQNLINRTASFGSLALHPDGSLLAVGESVGRITLWNVATGVKVGEFTAGHTKVVRSLAFSADGLRLASGGDDKLVCVWSVAEQRRLAILAGHRSTVVGVSLGDGGKLHSLGSDYTIKLWSLSESPEFQQHVAQAVAVSPDGEQFVEVRAPRAAPIKTIVLRNARSGDELWSHPLGVGIQGEDFMGGARAHSDVRVEFLPDGKSLVVHCRNKAQIVNLSPPLSPRDLAEWPGTFAAVQQKSLWAVSDDGQWLAAGTSLDGNLVGFPGFKPANPIVRLYRLATGEVAGAATVERLLGLEFERNSNHLLVATRGGVLKEFGHAGGPPEIVVSRWSIKPEFAATKQELCRKSVGQALTGGPDPPHLPGWLRLNEQLYFEPVGDVEAKLIRWNLATGKQEVVYEGHAGKITSLAVHPDGRTLATGSEDGTVRLWDLATGDEKLLLTAREAGSQVFGFVAAGRTLVTKRLDGGKYAISFWRGATDKELTDFREREPGAAQAEAIRRP